MEVPGLFLGSKGKHFAGGNGMISPPALDALGRRSFHFFLGGSPPFGHSKRRFVLLWGGECSCLITRCYATKKSLKNYRYVFLLEVAITHPRCYSGSMIEALWKNCSYKFYDAPVRCCFGRFCSWPFAFHWGIRENLFGFSFFFCKVGPSKSL